MMNTRSLSLIVSLFCALGIALGSAAGASADTGTSDGLAPYSPPKGTVSPNATSANGTFVCTKSFVTVQATASGYATGNCLNGVHLRRETKSAMYNNLYWDGGYIFGNYSGCGYIEESQTTSAYASTEKLCGGSPDMAPSAYQAANNNGSGANGGCSWNGFTCTNGTQTVSGATCTEYGNFRPWLSGQTPTDPVGTLPAGTTIRWRYWSKYDAPDGYPMIMIRDDRRANGAGNWVFVPFSCISGFPGYTTSL